MGFRVGGLEKCCLGLRSLGFGGFRVEGLGFGV